MSRYNVLHILPDLALGGGQVMVLRLLDRLHKKGHGVMVVSYGTDQTMTAQYRQAGVSVYELNLRGIAQMRTALQQVQKIIQANPISIIHTHGTAVDKSLGHLLAKRFDLPQVTTLHGMPPTFSPSRRRLRSYLRKLYEYGQFRLDWQLAKSRLAAVVAVSDAVLDAWSPIIQPVARSGHFEQSVIHWGVNADEFRLPGADVIQRIREEILGPGDSQASLILAVSRLHASKNVSALVQAMKTTLAARPDTVLCIAGDGPERAGLVEHAQASGIAKNIRFLGQRNDVPVLFSAADLAVFPSLNEGFGMVALEALAAGTALVCFDLPSLRTLSSEADAFYVAGDNDPETLGREMIRALADPQLKQKGRKARQLVLDRWSLEQTAEAYDRMYRRILSARNAER